jgi:hypothetical protein
LMADVAVYSLNSESLFSTTIPAETGEEETKPVVSLSQILKQADGIRFVLLKLKDGSGRELSRNTYWLDPHNNFKSLKELPRAGVDVKIIKKEADTGWTIRVTNPTDKVAFFVRLQLMQGREEITPSLWNSNYITLAPGESIPVEVTIPARLKLLNPVIQVSGWNVEAIQLPTWK